MDNFALILFSGFRLAGALWDWDRSLMVFEDVSYKIDIYGQHLVGIGGSGLGPLGVWKTQLLFYYMLDCSFIRIKVGGYIDKFKSFNSEPWVEP